jgi:seryl-tRNA(Sec) selenium transferase
MIFYFLQTDAVPWYKTILDFWPVIAWLVAGVAAIAGAVWAFRRYEKAGIDKTNEKAVNALKEYSAALEQQIKERDAEIEQLNIDCEDKQSEFLELESEYKAVAGIVLSELLTFAGRYDEHRATLAEKESQIRVLKLQILAMEQRDADLHTSKP